MPRAEWTLRANRPVIELSLIVPDTGRPEPRVLVADTGAGTRNVPFELILEEEDCILCAHEAGDFVSVSGAYTGSFRTYAVQIEVSSLGFSRRVYALAVDRVPKGYHGIAAFRFLNRFGYGNFGDPNRFGLEVA